MSTHPVTAPVTGRRDFTRSNQIQARLHEMVPGGAHTYARGADQYPEAMAPIIARGHGSRAIDVDGNEFVEYGIGLRAVTLGHGFAPVVAAVTDVITRGVNFSRPTYLEHQAAEDFLQLVPTADMVKFAKNGSDATTAAIRLARAATGREGVGACTQPFFSVDDWFIGLSPMNAGIPASTTDPVYRFHFNDISSVEAMFDDHGPDLACVILEAATSTAEPTPGFLETLRALCDRHGTVLIFDEMITGFRWSEHGAQSLYGVVPDLSTWGKAMGNGFPIAALAGKRELMELGGLNTDAHRVFLLSTTHGPESASLAAFRAVVATYATSNPIATMTRFGTLLRDGVNERAVAAGVGGHVSAIGRPASLVFTTADTDGVASQAFRTLFMQELIDHGVLGQSFVCSAAHTDTDLEITLHAVEQALRVYRRALEAGSVDGLLRGRPVAPALRATAAPRRLRTSQ
ncbi:glutamate-1-semialdehyde 2,1-aminomutase [Williamsia sp. CHRR-6]|nr:glutamate-1-semialdehyde 2,1-aminomutase [Williamsia sp. CHRR-6]MBT0566275.1 glutamate-1-semialdehyde 2,1-aminomutase [Williamsia sp. CHRR-6]